MSFFDKKLTIIFVVTLISIGAAGFFYFKWQQTLPEVVERKNIEEAEEIAQKISVTLELPEGEKPELITISSLENIPNTPLFSKAEVGDKLLIYRQADRVFLYRPKVGKIIETGSVAELSVIEPQLQNSVGGLSTPGSSGAESTVPSDVVVRVAYYNGSGVSGRAKEYETQMNQWFLNTKTSILTNAAATYPYSIVVDLKGTYSIEVEEIARRIGGKVEGLPAGESRPDGDILIIVGESQL